MTEMFLGSAPVQGVKFLEWGKVYSEEDGQVMKGK
jgi:hypothetical protein